MSHVDYSIVVPCFGSGEWLEELVQRTEAAMKSLGSFELILINDKSPDMKTWAEIERLAAEYRFVRGLDLLYNVGQFRAILCGIDRASGAFLITMDDDLQHPPEEIPKLIDAMHANPTMDCIIGKYITKHHSWVRNAGSRLFQSIMSRLYKKPPGLVTTSFRIMPMPFAKSVSLYRIAAPQLGPMMLSLSKKMMNVPVEHAPRKFGSSGYGLFRCMKETFQGIVNASTAPLRLFTATGLLSAIFAFSVSFFYLMRWVFGGIGVAGYTSLILAISFFSGMILAGVGILGEYIGRVIQELTGMPRYQIQKEVGLDS